MREPSERTRAGRKAFSWIFLAFVSVFVLVTRGHFQTIDEVAVYQQTRSLWSRGDLDVAKMINTRVGRNGRRYSPYGAGQSIAAVPFYAAGTLLRNVIGDKSDLAGALKGPMIKRSPELLWGGEIEIFAVALFGAFVTASLCVLFFAFSLHLGTTVRSALVGVSAFGLSSQVAGYSTTFFQHSLETLMVFGSFLMLFVHSRRPSSWRAASAGALLGYAVLTRIQTLVLVPALSAYFLWNTLGKSSSHALVRRSFVGAIRQCAPFFALLALGIAAHIGVNAFKFGQATVTGRYAGARFDTPLLESMFGFLFSPGESIFVFSPALLLLPLYWPPFYRRFRAEAICIAGVATSYLLFYGKFRHWHGQWCFGPRYLLALVPFLMLPMAVWWDRAKLWQRVLCIVLSGIGAFVQVLSVAVNFSTVFYYEQYTKLEPTFGYLFIPEISQLATHYRALMAGNNRVDMWLVSVYRSYGALRVAVLALPWVALLALSCWRLRRIVKRPRPAQVHYYDGALLHADQPIASSGRRAT
jgi:hypothetical protein